MNTELKPGMRVRITDPAIPCKTGTLILFGGVVWIVRVDDGGWEWDEDDARSYPDAPISVGDRGFLWVLPKDLKPLAEPIAGADFWEAIEHLEDAIGMLKRTQWP